MRFVIHYPLIIRVYHKHHWHGVRKEELQSQTKFKTTKMRKWMMKKIAMRIQRRLFSAHSHWQIENTSMTTFRPLADTKNFTFWVGHEKAVAEAYFYAIFAKIKICDGRWSWYWQKNSSEYSLSIPGYGDAELMGDSRADKKSFLDSAVCCSTYAIWAPTTPNDQNRVDSRPITQCKYKNGKLSYDVEWA